MTKNILLLIVFISSISFTVFGQEKSQNVADSDFRAEFETWKAANQNNNSRSLVFLTAQVKRDDDRTATVKIGVGNFGNSFQVTVKPLKIEKNADGKFIQTELPEAATLSMKGNSTNEEFANPTIKIFADSEANAVEITVKINGNENGPKLTLGLSGNSKGQIVSAVPQ